MEGIDRLHQIAEDVGRTVWLRDLGAALSDTADAIEGGMRDLSGYESDVLAWVEKNGGLDAVNERTMPDDMEWPRYADGSPVDIGDDVIGPDYGERIHVDEVIFHANGFTLRSKGGDGKWYESDDRFERPAVLAADGEPLEVGQTVWDGNGDELVIVALEDGGHTVTCRYTNVGDGIPIHGMWSPSDLTHQRPVLDADGVPIKVGDTVYGTVEGGPFTVTEVSDKGSVFVDALPDTGMHGSMLTHTKPEPTDSWEKWREDFIKPPCVYCRDILGVEFDDDTELDKAFDARNQDMECRARALAERGE